MFRHKRGLPAECTFDGLVEYIQAGRNKRYRNLTKSLLAVLCGDKAVAVRYHSTNIATFDSEGGVTLRMEGWDTVSTRANIKRVTGAVIFTKPDRGTRVDNRTRLHVSPLPWGVPFMSGIRLNARTGEVLEHPMLQPGGDVRNMMEPVMCIDKEKLRDYCKARRELVKFAKAVTPLVDHQIVRALCYDWTSTKDLTRWLVENIGSDDPMKLVCTAIRANVTSLELERGDKAKLFTSGLRYIEGTRKYNVATVLNAVSYEPVRCIDV